MALLSVVALAVALSLDSLGVGVAYGLRRIRVPWTLYLVVGLPRSWPDEPGEPSSSVSACGSSVKAGPGTGGG